MPPSSLQKKTLTGPATDQPAYEDHIRDVFQRVSFFESRRIMQEQRLALSIIVPVFNERENLPLLLNRIRTALKKEPYEYEIIVVDDHSEDGTLQYLQKEEADVEHVVSISKQGKRGKASSLLEGFAHARGAVIVMIDADLQYPPEAIPGMIRKLNDCDIVVARRTHYQTSLIRSFLSGAYRLIFGRMLLGLHVDVQSGLKVFRREILDHIRLKTSGWGFDYNFLYRAARMGYRIGERDIVFERRQFGKSHVHTIGTGIELTLGAVWLRLKHIPKDLFPFLVYPHKSEYHAAGFGNTQDYLFLPDIHSSRRHIYAETVSLGICVISALVLAVWGISVLLGTSPLLVISGSLAIVYLGLIFFKLFVVYKSINRPLLNFSRREVAALSDDDLPLYTILIPLYQEAEVIPQIMKAMASIDYPTDKLEIIITLEEYDHETIEAIQRANPPSHFRMLILPNVNPKSKPKALNVAFKEVKGEFLVIFDAEIIPDSDQLKKAVLGFRKFSDLAAIQTRLDHYNMNQNWITKLFNAEFSFYYDLFLPGLQELGFPLPLSGHSTHFRRDVIEAIGGWDPYNMTEDCDMGMRIARLGFKTEIMDSLSQEEATCSFDAWVKQRSRWMKGFIQTSIVHLRHPLRFKREIGGWKNFAAFLVIVPGSVIMNVLNLFYWGLLIAWFITQSPMIQGLFPRAILYPSLFSFIVGNFTFTYLNLVGSYKRKRFSMVKYNLLTPIYWLMLAYAGVRATVQLFVSPHLWEKTTHGKHLLPTSPYAPIPS